MKPQIEFYKTAFWQQGNAFDILVFVGTLRYQYGRVLSDVLHSILKFISKFAVFLKPVVIKGVQTFLKAGS